MRIPLLDETQKHLAGAGYALRHAPGQSDSPGELQLIDKDGDLRETFHDLLDFWIYWLAFAARVLTQEARIRKVVHTYLRRSERQRVKLAEEVEAYVSGLDRSPIELLFSQAGNYSTLQLPRNWKTRLISNLNGEMPDPWFNTEVIDALIAVDQGLGVRWSNRSQIYRIPVGALNVMLSLPNPTDGEHGHRSQESSASTRVRSSDGGSPARSAPD